MGRRLQGIQAREVDYASRGNQTRALVQVSGLQRGPEDLSG